MLRSKDLVKGVSPLYLARAGILDDLREKLATKGGTTLLSLDMLRATVLDPHRLIKVSYS